MPALNRQLNKRVLFTIFILSVWLLFGGFKLKNYYQPPKETAYLTASYIEKVVVQEHFYGIYMRDTRIGYMKRLMLPTNTGYKMFEEGVMRISFLGEKREIRMNMYSDMDKDFRLRSFVFQINSDKDNMSVKGEVEGKNIAISFLTEGKKNVYRIPMKERPIIPSAIVPYMVKSGFNKDKAMKISIFDPSTIMGYSADISLLGWEKISIEGEEIRVFHMKTTFKGIEVHGWVDESGTIVKELSPIGLIVQKEKEKKESDYFDANLLASVATIGRIENPKNTSSMKIKIEAKKELIDVLKRYYPVKENILEIQRGNLSHVKLNPASFLEPSPFINSDDTAIRSFLPNIIGSNTRDIDKVHSIMVWVHKNLKKTPTFSIPLARDVFIKRAGDCNEHAVIFAAFARAAHIPCVIASGMVYNNDNFYYHAWNLVYIEDKWVDVDSTFNQFPADATHIILTLGDISDSIEIMQFLKNITIHVLDVK